MALDSHEAWLRAPCFGRHSGCGRVSFGISTRSPVTLPVTERCTSLARSSPGAHLVALPSWHLPGPEPLALKLTLSRWPSSLCSCHPLLLPASIISKCRTILSPTHPRSGARNGSPTSESQVLESREYGGFGTMRVRQSICRPFLGRRARRRREAAAEARGCSSTWSRSSAPEFTKTAREVDSQGC